MRQLIWKELREQRFIPVVYSFLTIASVIVWYMVRHWQIRHNQLMPIAESAGSSAILLWILLAAAGVISGGGAVAPEIGKGTLGFLQTFPTARLRLWSAKVLSGLIVMSTTMGCVLIAYFATVDALYGREATRLFVQSCAMNSSYRIPLLFMAGLGCYGYFVSFFMSIMVDRALVAVSFALIGGTCIVAAVMSFTANTPVVGQGVSLLALTLLLGLTLAFAVASYYAFSSENLLIPKIRIKRGFSLLAGCLVLVSMGAMGARSMLIQSYVTHQEIERSRIDR